jgi:hypothetical protein
MYLHVSVSLIKTAGGNSLSCKCDRNSWVCFVYGSQHYGATGTVRASGQHRDLDMRGARALLPGHTTTPHRRLVPLRPSCLHTGTEVTHRKMYLHRFLISEIWVERYIYVGNKTIDICTLGLFCYILRFVSLYIFIRTVTYILLVPFPCLSVSHFFNFPFDMLPIFHCSVPQNRIQMYVSRVRCMWSGFELLPQNVQERCVAVCGPRTFCKCCEVRQSIKYSVESTSYFLLLFYFLLIRCAS